MGWLEIALRAVSVFVVMMIRARVLGRKLISQMTFFDFVAGVAIGSIGASIIYTSDAKLGAGLIGLVLFSALSVLTGILAIKSLRGRRIVNAGPVVLIRNDEILEKELSKVRLTYNDLLMLLRKKDVFYTDEVELAVFETDGSLSVLRLPEVMPATRKEFHFVSSSRGLPHTFVMDGRLVHESLRHIGKDAEWAERTIREHGASSLQDVALAQVDQTGKVMLDLRKDTYLH